ncbi:glycoside hydrolase domain-containing protein [Actinomadura fibrosa]|uniref:Glycoside hydrolase domain-containing protein n=1 Tax=Actinomadura fibrosa TaxID=111802 RepID=A0ABW2XWC9_9ACTN|nr:glycoside hydrolase domain-containing protein [Actinomadura fibrosa]
MSIFGVDYAWGRPGPAALKKAGAKFACRYLSHDTTGKNLTRAEADQLSGAGIWLVVVWETTANRALSGRSGGEADARDAAAQAARCGMPDDRPIYFAVDWDATSGQQSTINAYLDGAASVLGRDRVGLYAGYGPVSRAFDAKKITYGWQTYAWSGGRWDSRAQLQQYSNDHEINGVGCDYDRAVADDYGQWKVGESPMALSNDDLKKIRDIVWNTDTAPAPSGSSADNPTWRHVNIIRDTYSSVQQVKAAVAELAQQSGGDPAEAARLVLAGLPPESIAAAIPDEVAGQVLAGLQARLEG